MRDFAVTRPRRRARFLSTRRKLSISRPGLVGAVIALSLGAIGGILAPSHGVVFGSGVVLALILLLLWQENEPPLLMFPALYQWMQVSTKAVMSAFEHVPVNALAEFDSNLEPAIYLGLCAVAALTIGMRLALGRPERDWNAALKNEAMALTGRSALLVATIAILLGHLMFYLMRYVGPASQLFYALANIRFAGLFAMAYWCFVNRRGFAYLFVVVAIEFAIGVTGFFSDFKAPIFVIIFAAVAAGHRPKLREMAFVGTMGAVLLLFGSVWSYVKVDYRLYVSGGTGDQIIVVPLEDRLAYLGREVEAFNGARFVEGLNRMLGRQSYVDFLAATMTYVPQVVPHEQGKRITSTVIHVLTPRIFFPDKKATELDTDVTLRYTGLPLQVRQGTSISIGYVGELYIDFGTIGAVISSLLIGLGFGAGYKALRRRGRGSLLLTYGARTTVLAVILPFETALIKYIGGAGVAFISAYIMQVLIVPGLSDQLRLRRQIAPPPSRLEVAG